MLVRFRVNLGSDDAKKIQRKTGVTLEIAKCTLGTERDIPTAAVELLASKGIVEAAEKAVHGVAKKSEITAPAKS